MDALDPQLRDLLYAHKSFFNLTESGKIECTLNGHTLPARLDAVSSFIQGAKFQKLSRRQAADQALQKYEPFIVQSNNFPLLLYCALTGQLIDKSVEAVKKHMKGKKFQRAKDRFAADELDLKPEPTLESFGIRPDKAAAAAKQQGQQQAAVNGSAAAAAAAAAAGGSEDEPGFWVPEGAESGSGEDEGDEEAGSSSDDDADADMEAGPLQDSEDDDPMEEDTDVAAAEAAATAAAAAAAAAKAKKSSRTANGTAEHKQKQAGSSKAGKGAAQNGTGVIGASKKRNAQRPSAAKKARH